jgi:hypothetical protein
MDCACACVAAFPFFGTLFAASNGLIALAVAWIAYQQHRLAREKFKLDLFEKRFAVYKATQKLLTIILINAKLEQRELFEFRGDTQDATFLFGQDIPAYQERLDRQALELMIIPDRLKELPHGEERTKLVGREHELIGILLDELPKLKDVFAPYLRFARWK